MTRGLAQPVAAGMLAAVVGFASSFAVVVHGLMGAGADAAQAASGLMAASVAMGLCGILLSVRLKMPISAAWSTPGAALLAASPPVSGGYAAAVGAFLLCGALIVLSGAVRPLGRLVAAIPAPLASAMLAGVLLPLCLAPVHAIAVQPVAGLAIVATWAVVGRVRRLLAVPAAVVVTGICVAVGQTLPASILADPWPHPLLVTPAFTVAAAVGTALPLFVVTMASQNIPGLAVLRINGYAPPPAPLLAVTGVGTLLAAPFCGIAVNLAAITAALCAGPDAGVDPSRRWIAALTTGVLYVAFGVFAGVATSFMAASPPVLIEAVAGLALLGALGAALHTATATPEAREPALVTFLVAAAGTTFLGIGGAFWGLLAGGAMMALTRLNRAR